MTRLNHYSRDFTGNCPNTFLIFFFSLQNRKKKLLQGEMQTRITTSIDNSCFAHRGFVLSGNIPGFHRWCDRGIGRGGVIMQSARYIRRQVEKGREKGKKEWIGQWDSPPGVSHLAGKLPRCSTKSRGNLGDYAARRSSRVRSPESRV